MSELPEGYFCPKCNIEATRDLGEHMRADGMPNLYVVEMAMNILFEAKCPAKLLQPIAEWSKRYANAIDLLTEEEQEKLKLDKWRKWATSHPPINKKG